MRRRAPTTRSVTLEDTAYTLRQRPTSASATRRRPANALERRARSRRCRRAGRLTRQRRGGHRRSSSSPPPTSPAASWCSRRRPTPTAAGYASFTFQVQDDGGTANGGVDLDQSPNTMTINVTAVNDAPAGTNKTVTALEDTAYTLRRRPTSASATRDAGNALAAVQDHDAAGSRHAHQQRRRGHRRPLHHRRRHQPAATWSSRRRANANGTAYASFTFQVQDDGGTPTAASTPIRRRTR